ncbi:MAG: tRNA (adenosine(37)-N6)-threonylcarbamoyltransferase complex ATPase subunit type 1 TsaE [Candidatus Yanofskybacteria bacterium RIFCSPHIGHO2_01_FULL_39_44]|nr:MAG: tRNA (adenosine(37)-N6)-threonylcarbamoyltransferase complex ATPase subunit type 1 TsaE [Candidatus Yanofskybacteria bacterium RIFCSPHIGHO2_01_FULL_39_44]
MKIMLYLSRSPRETEKLAGFLLAKFLKNNPPAGRNKSVVIALEGELGAGKTTFTKGLAKALGIKKKIKSPTFTLVKSYKIPTTYYKLVTISYLYHIDCYRLKNYKDLLPLGIKEIISRSENIVLIEWSDRVKEILPKKHIKIHIDHIDKDTRKITLK